MESDPALNAMRSTYFLRGLDETQLQKLRQALALESFAPGGTILRQGTPARSLYMVVQGQVERTERLPDGSTRQTALEVGDSFGETELIFGHPWGTTIRASKPTKLLRWSHHDLHTFLEQHPRAHSSLKFAARSRRLARKIKFPWLSADELIFGLARKHPIQLVKRLTVPGIMLAISAWLGWQSVIQSTAIPAWSGPVTAAVGLLFALWNWIDWGNDFYLVTNRRVVRVEKVIGIHDSRREAPIPMVLSVAVRAHMLGRILDYGDVVIRTYTGEITFHNIAAPHTMAAMVEQHWRRLVLHQQEEDRDTKVKAVREFLELEPAEPPENPHVLTPQLGTEGQPEGEIGLGRWTLELRFEEQGVITYRKHWAVLLRHLLLPSALLLAVLVAIGAQASDAIQLPDFPGRSVLGWGLAFISLLWWLYEYLDWANDLYQITPKQIVDVHRKPLGREVRKVAPLENILGTEVDRRGLFGLLLNYGAVTTNIGTEKLVFDGVYDPSGVQQEITRGLEKHLEIKQEGERRQRRAEMVEWLAVYHDESGADLDGVRSEDDSPSEA